MKTGRFIGDEGARMISEGLNCNNTLTYLDMCCDEKEEKEIRRNNKGNKEKRKRERNVYGEIMIMKMIYKWNK